MSSLRDRLAGGLAGMQQWPPGSRKFAVLAGAVIAIFGAYQAVFLAVTADRLAQGGAAGDFIALWSAARFAFAHPAAEIYDPHRLHAAQVAMGMAPQLDYPFPYPPSFLLILAPLALLPQLPAYVAASAVTLALFVWATVGRAWRTPMLPAVLVAPTTTITIVAGQTGFLAAALLVGGFRLTARRPIAAGVLFGLLTYKPQLGLLVPVALVSAGQWRVIAAAVTTVAGLIALTSTVWGFAVWPAWIASIGPYAAEFNGAAAAGMGHLMPTVWAGLMRLRAPPGIADLGQGAAAAAVAALVWRRFRAGPRPLAAAALMVATFLATPHALVYDMPMMTTAMLWTIAERHSARAAFGSVDILVMLVASVSPIVLVAGTLSFPVAAVSLALLLVVIARPSPGCTSERGSVHEQPV